MSVLKKTIVDEFNESLKTLGMGPELTFTDRDYKKLISEGPDLWGDEVNEQLNDVSTPIQVEGKEIELSESTLNRLADRIARLLEVYMTPYVDPKKQTTMWPGRDLTVRPPVPKEYMDTAEPDGHSPAMPPKETVIRSDQPATHAADMAQSTVNPVPTDVLGAIMTTAKYLKAIGHDESAEYLNKVAQGQPIDKKYDTSRIVSKES